MRVLNVSDFVEVVNAILKETWSGEEIAVEGEVSGFRVSQGQWVSFDLKDEKALVNVFMTVWNLKVPVEDGMKVRVFGVPRIYPKYGKFSLSAERVELAGEGALRKALALLRKRLTEEGLFDPSRKRSLPRFPERIALIASRESAAYGDFVRVMNERWGGVEIDLYHVIVQGEKAPRSVVNAIRQAQEGEYDAIVITRGGGSLEELMAFNDEQVVRAVHGSRIPTLVAIGHERDITLAEDAADVRGSTPTDCARRLVPDRRDVLYELANLVGVVEQSVQSQIEEGKELIDRAMLAPGMWLSGRLAQLETGVNACLGNLRQWFKGLEAELDAKMRVLSSLDPRRVLARGYAIVKDPSGRGISRLADLKLGQEVSVMLQDGEAGMHVSRLAKEEIQRKLL